MVTDRFPAFTARVTFLPPKEGGRRYPAVDSRQYRPHIVLGDPDRREPVIAADGRTLTEDHLAVCFTGDSRPLLPDRSYDVELLLASPPEEKHPELVAEASFTIREGGRIVGFGHVLRGL